MTGKPFSKVFYTVTLHSKCTRALTFENLCLTNSSVREANELTEALEGARMSMREREAASDETSRRLQERVDALMQEVAMREIHTTAVCGALSESLLREAERDRALSSAGGLLGKHSQQY